MTRTEGVEQKGVMAADLLDGTPFLIADRPSAQGEFERLLRKGGELKQRFARVGKLVHDEARSIFESFGLVLRSELVSESSELEYIRLKPEDVRRVVSENRDLLNLPAHVFVHSVRMDSRTYEAIGLYKAQMLAEDWAGGDAYLREIEIRQLHSLITGGAYYSGRYREGDVWIQGASHRPPSDADAREGMRQLAAWWNSASGVPILDAAVIHAWLTHLHPFQDGNGRLARVLANMILSHYRYPPLIVRAGRDRGEYYDALAACDDGDILPLLQLFTRVVRGTTKEMERPGYVEGVIRDRTLTTPGRQQSLWQDMTFRFADAFRRRLRDSGYNAEIQGYPSSVAFRELAGLDPDGNSWFLKVYGAGGGPEWLLWFGYNSPHYQDLYEGPSGYPSIFLSERCHEADAVHPYTPVSPSSAKSLWTELVLVPGASDPARMRQGHRWQEGSVDWAAVHAAEAVLKAGIR